MARKATKLPTMASRPKLAEEVTETLRNAILGGVYRDGAHLVLENLASELGVSIMPVRESLLALSHEGLVEALPRRGFRARPLNDRDIEDLFTLHAFLSATLGARAAAVISEEELAQLDATQAEFEQLAAKPQTARNTQKLHELNSAFHRTINHCAEGDRLRWFLRITSRFVRQDFYNATQDDWIEATRRDHPRIIEALRNRDAARSRELIMEHFRQGAELSRPQAGSVRD